MRSILWSGWGWKGAGGALRIGAVHYNTLDEVDRLIATLTRIARDRP